MSSPSPRLGNIPGAFADGAVLLPLLVALALTTNYNGAILLASAGVAYIGAGIFFKIPMPVQPLKSIVVAALAVGATMAEIQLSGMMLGLICLVLAMMPANRWANAVPRSLVHGLQFGLGLLLIGKGLSWNFNILDDNSFTVLAVIAIAALALVILGGRSKLPLMGWLASVALIVAAFQAFFGNSTTLQIAQQTAMRIDIILALLLPQIALTLTNSVVATSDVATRYYGDTASRATPKNLLRSIGGGNIISAAIGGLPFCHGCGGLTAHKAGGATTWHMNLIIGGTLIGFALIHVLIAPVIPEFHPWIIGILLTATGIFHLKLAEPSLSDSIWRYQILIMAVATIVSQNLLIVLLIGIAAQIILNKFKPKRQEA